MLFNSIPFAVLLAITFALYYLPGARRLQVGILVVSSLVFYGWTDARLLFLLALSVGVNALTTYRVHFETQPARARAWMITGIVVNLAVLAAFKYGGLFTTTFFGVDPKSEFGAFMLRIPLPIGISFFTFHGISQLVDTFRARPERRAGSAYAPLARDPETGREIPLAERGLARHALRTTLYISMFSQLVAGPILKSQDFLPQIRRKHLRDVNWSSAFHAILLGYFLKMVIADNLKDFTYWIAWPYFLGRSSLDLVALLFGYSMRIFADFAGYSLIAIGTARLFGYELMTNFNFPYISRTFSEFWRRWHISLSSWLRQYLYVPLGGNRKGELRAYFNLFIVMFLGGLWHGAAWSYAVWGTTHGAALALERLFQKHVKLPERAVVSVLQALFVFAVVTLAWLLFVLTDFGQALAYFKAIAANRHVAPSPMTLAFIAAYSLPVVAWHLWYIAPSAVKRSLEWLRAPAYAAMLMLLVTNAGTGGAFIYFQF